ncbi:hypothetical protein AJ78_00051 [Emergomyces pasteurianus Ep9510]|uniref:Enoyl reductase (ER) domain-containing protein n=1 Tax=Emergomyces pasteurianus Ep9510 TaxID=1447872 RepID=A0A1J9QIK7_9EURO|nr:hypothetical protein AJ78_00051 [Emergomyces pasteurianus Ep9510]
MPENEASWISEPKGDLQNQAFAIQPLDASVRAHAYMEVPYPFILGNGVSGVVEEVGPSVTKFKKGDRVVSDTPAYQLKQSKYGGWQKYVVGVEATTAKIPGNTTFEDAAAIPFALLTAVAALQLKLGMEKSKTKHGGTALIWGASGSVGGYAVQYAASVGYNVVATASPRKFDNMRSLGVSEVLDYKDEQIVSKLKHLGPYDFIMLASGDAKGANDISEILQPTGGRFVSTRAKSEEMQLASNVSLIYDAFSMTTQKEENADFTKWWYGEYLPKALAGGVTPTPLEKRPGGLQGVQEACNMVLAGQSPKKLVINLQ